jgi:hypothetical protein
MFEGFSAGAFARSQVHDCDGTRQQRGYCWAQRGRSGSMEISAARHVGSRRRFVGRHLDCGGSIRSHYLRHEQSRGQGREPAGRTIPLRSVPPPVLQAGALPASLITGKKLIPHLRPRNRRARISVMLRKASPELVPLRLGKLNGPRRVCRDAIPDVADKLDALGNRQLENLCLGCAHVTDSTTNLGSPLSRGISGVCVEMGYVRACIRLWNSARSMSFAVPASISASRRTISCSQASLASLSAGASRLVTSACARSARSASGSESASDLSLLRVSVLMT